MAQNVRLTPGRTRASVPSVMSSLPAAKSRTELSAKGESTKERILAHARQVFLTQGYDQLILRRIAEALDMKLSNVQYYYKTKDDLVTAIIEGEERHDEAIITAGLEKFADPEEVVRYIVPKFLAHWRSRSGIIFAAREFFVAFKPSMQLTKAETEAVLFERMDELVTRFRPDLKPAEVRKRRRLIVSLLDGAAMNSDPGQHNQFIRSLEDTVIAIARS